MTHSTLFNVSAIDGRYHKSTQPLAVIFSEYALIKYRIHIEVEWLIHLSIQEEITELPTFSTETITFLRQIVENFSLEKAEEVKAIEAITNHDVKAVEYYLRQQCENHTELKNIAEFWHFACTSEDINNLSYALMLKDAMALQSEQLAQVIEQFAWMAKEYANVPMLAKTHGQSASPTTMGKEMANIGYRLYRQITQLKKQEFLGKINGAVGNYNAHLVAYPKLDWQQCSEDFIKHLGLAKNPYTTQIEPHDYCAEIAHISLRMNTILIDACRDIWGYISLGYFGQKLKEGEVGSSTMPHKVNPIDFENAEGNLGLSNALLSHMAEKLPISRWQRDLSDSTVQRSWGSAFGHLFIALSSLKRGLNKLTLSSNQLSQDLIESPEVVTEAIQTVMRQNHIADSYDIIKKHSRGQRLTEEKIHAIIDELPIGEQYKNTLAKLSSSNYLGNASQQAEKFYHFWQENK